jgi:hypothetical protein
MKNLMESYTARLAASMQRLGSNIDPEILMLPGGSLIALALWLYERRPHGRSAH